MRGGDVRRCQWNDRGQRFRAPEYRRLIGGKLRVGNKTKAPNAGQGFPLSGPPIRRRRRPHALYSCSLLDRPDCAAGIPMRVRDSRVALNRSIDWQTASRRPMASLGLRKSLHVMDVVAARGAESRVNTNWGVTPYATRNPFVACNKRGRRALPRFGDDRFCEHFANFEFMPSSTAVGTFPSY
jgi:hypothetical protein